ncbi:LAGLIDADG family homing endonuclease [Paenibacillus illinoisensis]|uniref:DOD-type homing endonuclease domain-containing protein n=1 Tax=Paenibacillus illinoisensis TaxID=59845 RepID=A0A2W0C7D1_9BACL|nr:LAGLIDADG family homing endonuclease [Paenibacillus illinoisensis]PYY28346.1 hypothetical protein PIL02S_03497 [Paenibacillus illinoisensis]
MATAWSEAELNFLRKNYKTMTYKEISKQLNRSKAAIDLKINRIGLKKSKYTYDHDFFEKIDTEDKAYWLGFIYADGCISIKEEINSCELSIKLQKNDAEHLKKFNKSLNGNIEVTTFDRTSNFDNKLYGGCQIRIYSQQMVRDLQNCGITTNKSLTISFPTLEQELIRHFVRGFFDGDGCLTKNNHKNGKSYVRADFTCGSEVFVHQLRDILYKSGINTYIHREPERPYRLVIGGMKNCDKFFKYIYDDATIYLERKMRKKLSLYRSLNIEQRLLR